MSSPLSVTPSRPVERVKTFKRILETILSIYAGKRKLYENLGFSNTISKPLSQMIKYLQNPTDTCLVDLLLNMADQGKDLYKNPIA